MNALRYLALSALAFALVPTGAVAAPDKVAYELQQQCGRQASEWFKREWGDGTESNTTGRSVAHYRSHYNPRLNKCFFLLTVYSTLTNKERTRTVEENLFDLNENRDFGFLSEMSGAVMGCKVESRECSSRAEWESLLAPYLND